MLLDPDKIIETVEGLHGLCLGRRYGVGVDVRCGAVAQPLGDGFDILLTGDEEGAKV